MVSTVQPSGSKRLLGQRGAAAAAQRRHVDAERDAAVGELGLGVAAAGQRGPEGLLEGHREHAGGRVRAVVDVLGELAAARFGLAADQGDGIDLEQQRGGAAPGRRLGIEDVRRTRRGVERLQPVGVLVQQVPEVGRGRPGGGDRQQHQVIVSDSVRPDQNQLSRSEASHRGFRGLLRARPPRGQHSYGTGRGACVSFTMRCWRASGRLSAGCRACSAGRTRTGRRGAPR